MTFKSCHFKELFQTSFIKENKNIQWKLNSTQLTDPNTCKALGHKTNATGCCSQGGEQV